MADSPRSGSRQAARPAALVLGAMIVLLGLVFLLDKFYRFLSIDRMWPLFMLIPAALLAAVLAEKGREAAGVIVPITILVFYAGYFIWLNYTSWDHSGVTWPNYLIGPGLGFLILYFIERDSALLIPAAVLLGLAAVFYGAFFGNTLAVGILLLGTGLFLIVRAMWTLRLRKKAD